MNNIDVLCCVWWINAVTCVLNADVNCSFMCEPTN
jgi:hypothetical protein